MPENEGERVRIVVTGATGNIGTSAIRLLAEDRRARSVVGVARRLPRSLDLPAVEWAQADVAKDDLRPVLQGADVVVHLAWLFQPTHDPVTTWNANVLGSLRVFDSAVEAGVGAIVYSSSVGAYSPGPKDRRVDEAWPTHGWPGAAYTREKAYLERALDAFEQRHPGIRVVRLRPGFVFKEEAASEQRRLFAGPLIPRQLVRPGLIPVVPDLPGLRMQAVHSSDVGEAVLRAVFSQAAGAFNVAAEPEVDAQLVAELLGARIVKVPLQVTRTALTLAWWAHLVPASPGLLDAVLHLPIMDTSRIRSELGWSPNYDARQALQEAISGIRRGSGGPSEPLAPDSAASRAHEMATGIGGEP